MQLTQDFLTLYEEAYEGLVGAESRLEWMERWVLLWEL